MKQSDILEELTFHFDTAKKFLFELRLKGKRVSEEARQEIDEAFHWLYLNIAPMFDKNFDADEYIDEHHLDN